MGVCRVDVGEAGVCGEKRGASEFRQWDGGEDVGNAAEWFDGEMVKNEGCLKQGGRACRVRCVQTGGDERCGGGGQCGQHGCGRVSTNGVAHGGSGAR